MSCGPVRCPDCKYTVNEPLTIDGAAAWSIVCRPGVLSRAGMAGVVVGLDWNAALALSAIAGIQPGVAGHLLAQIEFNMLSALQDNGDG